MVTLFDPDPVPIRNARRTDPDTSKEAALFNPEGRRTQCQKILDLMMRPEHLERGMTADEVSIATGIRPDIASRRITDLVQRYALTGTNTQRVTSLGVKAMVWKVTSNARNDWRNARNPRIAVVNPDA